MGRHRARPLGVPGLPGWDLGGALVGFLFEGVFRVADGALCTPVQAQVLAGVGATSTHGRKATSESEPRLRTGTDEMGTLISTRGLNVTQLQKHGCPPCGVCVGHCLVALASVSSRPLVRPLGRRAERGQV